jgi:eukaryotic-like serine/threonine-protein kinase
VVAARAPGFKPLEKRVTPENESPVDLQLKLESDEFDVKVESEPSGATIFAGGRTWGTTPMQVRLPSSVKQVSLKLRCHEDASVNVAPAEGESTAVVNKALKKKRERGCR